MSRQYFTPTTLDETRPEVELMAQAFDSDVDERVAMFEKMGPGCVRLLKEGDETVAGLFIYDMGQFFGGRSVRTWGIAGVATAAHRRGAGAAHELMCHTVREAHEAGVPLSTLHPATVGLYRKSGYELAGHLDQWELPLREGAALKAEGQVVPFGQDGIDRAMALHCQRALHGSLDRHPIMVDRRLREAKPELHGYLLQVAGRDVGHIVLEQRPGGRYPRTLVVRDVVTLNAAAVRLAWSFVQQCRAQFASVHWWGAAEELQVMDGNVFPPRDVRAQHWMLRIVDVSAALAARGYPPINTEVHLAIADPIITANAGRYVLSLRVGQPTVQRGGGGHVKMDVRGLAALYSSHLTGEQLVRAGLAEGPANQVAELSQVFAGPRPCMSDHF
jgi:predicted acetyltransferase